MNRRDLLAGGTRAVATGIAVALAGCLDDGERADGADDGSGDEPDGGAEPPFELRAIHNTGSGDTVAVPESGRVSVVNFARTECPTTREHISELAAARETLAEEETDEAVRFFTIVQNANDPAGTDEEFAAWWEDTDGDWTLLFDEAGAAFDHYEVVVRPTTVFVGADGDVRGRIEGATSAGRIAERVRAAIEE